MKIMENGNVAGHILKPLRWIEVGSHFQVSGTSPRNALDNRVGKFNITQYILWRVTPCRNRVSTVTWRRELKRTEKIRREPTKTEERRSEPSQQNGGMFIFRCSAKVGYTRYAISTTIATVFGGVRSEELSWKPSEIQSQCLEVSL
jgi:hypothetical protein